MVLQQQSEVNIWGWADPSDTVSVTTSWDQKTYKTKTNNGAKWTLKVQTPIAGGPYTITITSGNTIVLEDVMIGEVWVCSGQSNMEWNGDRNLEEAVKAAPKAINKEIRFFYVPKSTSSSPQENVDAQWVVCNPKDMLHFSAIGYFFGENINKAIHTPMGLINSNWGGTPAETWTPNEVVESNPIIKKGANELGQFDWWPSNTAYAYNAMIAPLTNFNIAGVLWYQGESNTDTYYAYEPLFTGMINAWRKAWENDFAFYYVQIAPFAYGRFNVGALLREVQTKSSSTANTGMVVISDLVPDTTNIHPTLKLEVANRLSNMALQKHYGKKEIIAEGPYYNQHTTEKDNIVLQFTNVGEGLTSNGKPITQFEIAGIDHVFYPAQAKIVGNTIVVNNKSVKSPIAVRYMFNNTGIGNVFNKAGLPLNLFRTDDWKVNTEVIKK
jgi:sialate O-acetylesterase